MAHATHLTIGTADRIRLDARQNGLSREDEEGGNEMRQEVQVSITYALDRGDTNLVRLAEAKALEVQLAHEAVWNRIGAFSGGGCNASSTSGCCSGRSKASENREDDEDTEDGSDGRDDDPFAGLPHGGDDPFGGGPTPAGAARPFPAAPTNREPDPAPDAEPVTGPQKILIRSRAKKVGLTPYALESLVYQQFRVWKVEKLTKEQGVWLMDALERDLKEKEMDQKGINGKEGVTHASDTLANGNGHTATAGTA